MNILKDNIPVTMIRSTVDGFPQYPLPAGYCIRPYKPRDEYLWYELEKATEKHSEITEAHFHNEFGHAMEQLPSRQFYLIAPDGIPMGTATAWFDPDRDGKAWGRLHWVAIHPDHQGKGLAKPFLSYVCNRFKQLGHQRAYLATSSARLAAIHLYRHFGFKQEIRTEDDRAVWDKILLELKKGTAG